MSKIPPWLWIVLGVIVIASFSTGSVLIVDYLTSSWMQSQNAQKWAPYLNTTATSFGIPPELLARIAYQESHFVQSIIDGTDPSTAGALGLMQLLPKYFTTVQRAVPFSDTDTQDQITEAAAFLVKLFAHFNDWTLATAAYNAGQTRIDEVLAGTTPLPSQTADYIASISADLPDIVNPTLTA